MKWFVLIIILGHGGVPQHIFKSDDGYPTEAICEDHTFATVTQFVQDVMRGAIKLPERKYHARDIKIQCALMRAKDSEI